MEKLAADGKLAVASAASPPVSDSVASASQPEPPPFYPVAPEDGELDQINKVVDNVYLTNWRGADDKKRRKALGITHIAAVGSEFTGDTAKGITFWKFNIGDDESAEADMAKALRDGAQFVHKAVHGGGKVLVHCAAGISRSTTVVLAYLVVHQKKTLRESLGLVMAARRPVWPNDGFMRALISLESQAADVDASVADAAASSSDGGGVGDSPLRPALPRLMRGPTFVLEETRDKQKPALLTFSSTDSIDDTLRLSSSLDMRKLLAQQVTREASEARQSSVRRSEEDDEDEDEDEGGGSGGGGKPMSLLERARAEAKAEAKAEAAQKLQS